MVDDKFGRKTAQACWKLAIEHTIGKSKLNDVILGKPGGSTPAVGDGTEPSVFWKNVSPKGWKDTKFLKDPGTNTAAGATTGSATNTDYAWLKGNTYTYAAMNGLGTEITNIVNKLDELYESSLPSSPAQIRLTIPADDSTHSLSVVDGGSGYADATTEDMDLETDDVQPLTITADITVVGGIVTQASNPGPLPSGIVTSTFTEVPLISTSGMGVGASATLTVDGDSIGTCNMTSYGGGFTIGEVLVIDSYHQLAANGNGFQVTVTGVAQQEELKETVYICEGIGGDGSGLKVRVTQDENGGFSQITPSAIVDGGRDYTKDQIVVLSNSDGSGTIEAIIGEVE